MKNKILEILENYEKTGDYKDFYNNFLVFVKKYETENEKEIILLNKLAKIWNSCPYTCWKKYTFRTGEIVKFIEKNRKLFMEV